MLSAQQLRAEAIVKETRKVAGAYPDIVYELSAAIVCLNRGDIEMFVIEVEDPALEYLLIDMLERRYGFHVTQIDCGLEVRLEDLTKAVHKTLDVNDLVGKTFKMEVRDND